MLISGLATFRVKMNLLSAMRIREGSWSVDWPAGCSM